MINESFFYIFAPQIQHCITIYLTTDHVYRKRDRFSKFDYFWVSTWRSGELLLVLYIANEEKSIYEHIFFNLCFISLIIKGCRKPSFWNKTVFRNKLQIYLFSLVLYKGTSVGYECKFCYTFCTLISSEI